MNLKDLLTVCFIQLDMIVVITEHLRSYPV